MSELTKRELLELRMSGQFGGAAKRERTSGSLGSDSDSVASRTTSGSHTQESCAEHEKSRKRKNTNKDECENKMIVEITNKLAEVNQNRILPNVNPNISHNVYNIDSAQNHFNNINNNINNCSAQTLNNNYNNINTYNINNTNAHDQNNNLNNCQINTAQNHENNQNISYKNNTKPYNAQNQIPVLINSNTHTQTNNQNNNISNNLNNNISSLLTTHAQNNNFTNNNVHAQNTIVNTHAQTNITNISYNNGHAQNTIVNTHAQNNISNNINNFSNIANSHAQINSNAQNNSNSNNIEILQKRMKELENTIYDMRNRELKLRSNLDTGKNFIKDLLIDDHKIRKKRNFEKIIENSKRLGSYITVRKGTQFAEVWQDGYDFKEVEEKIIENSRLKDELEKCRKSINKKKPNDKNCLGIRSPTDRSRRQKNVLEETTSNNILNPQSPINSIDEYQRYEELYKIRLGILRKEELELLYKKEELEKSRDMHIKNIKLSNMEQVSRFSNNPIMHNRYLLLDMIGKGGFSEVFKAFDFNDFKYVACKIHQLSPQWREDQKANYIKHAVREYNIHKTLDHPNIVKLIDVFEIDNDSFATVMEYCDGDDLDTYLKRNKCIPERDARFIIIQIVLALKYLNQLKPSIIHYDLKPGNILLLSGIDSWHVKVADFGLSKIVPSENDEQSIDLTSPGAGTYWYLPPECFFAGVGACPPKISHKVDVWSVGVIFFQCLYGRRPFGHELSQARILEQNTILNATSITFPQKPQVSNDAKDFIRNCLVYDKETRMDVIQMSDSSYLKYKKQERSITNLLVLKPSE